MTSSDSVAFAGELWTPCLGPRFCSGGVAASSARGKIRFAPRQRRTPAAAKWICNSRPPWTVDVDGVKDDKLFELEENLADAVTKEDFDLAMQCRDEISRLQSAAYVDVLQAVMGFYKAFNNQSITDIARVFAQDEKVSCKHPVGPLIFGYLEVINTFGSLFSTGLPKITVRNIRISMRGSVAYATCDEIVEARRDPGTLRTNFKETNEHFSNGPAQLCMMSVNIFVKRNGQYLLTHHSSSPRGPLDF